MNCYCGEDLNATTKTIVTRHVGSEISVRNVPIYECSSGHYKLARQTRIRLKELIKEAKNAGEERVNFE